MPELPEVQTIVNDLNEKIINKKIINVEVCLKKIVKNSIFTFRKRLIGFSFKNITRKGKLIIFEISSGEFMLVHLRMTGQIIYFGKNKLIAGGHSQSGMLDNLPNQYTCVVVNFKNSKLFYNDVRRFGYLQIVNKKELNVILDKYGIDAMDKNLTLNKFNKLIQERKVNVKAFLLNQKFVSGIGNIYADEILFMSSVLPTRNVNTLDKQEIKKLYQNTKKILKKAIKHRGTTFNDYRDTDGNKGGFVKMLKVYGRDGRKCVRCGGIIKKIKVARRGTRYCEKCQS